MEAESLIINVTIRDLAGNVDHSTEWRGLRVSQDSPRQFFPGQLDVGEKGQFLLRPKLTSYSIIARATNSRSNKLVYLKEVEQADHHSKYRVVIEGQLHSSDGELSYKVDGASAGTFLMSREEVELAYKGSEFPYEYVSQSVDHVVKTFQLEVFFPQGFQLQAYPGVFVGQTETMHHLELNRVQFEPSNGRVRLTVDNPLVGVSYLIFWMPPSRQSDGAAATA